MAASAYATTSDLQTYLRDVSSSNNTTIWTTLLNNASRYIDARCGQFFYDDGAYPLYWDGDGTRELTTKKPFFTVTSIKMAHFENEATANWIDLTADGSDGVTPPSNFWLWPANPLPDDNTSAGSNKPFWGVNLAIIPKTGSNYLPMFFPGYRTCSITAHWGWPGVPDPIKNLTLKLASRAWRARDAGWQVVQGSPDIGFVDMSRLLDREDDWLLTRSAYVHRSF